MTSESAIKLIKAYIAQRQWNNIINLCTSLLQDNPQRLELYPCLAKAYSNQGRLIEAIAAYKKVLDTPLNQAEIHAELGLLYSKKKQYIKAAWHYQQAKNINPHWAELQYNLAVVLHQLGDWEKTIAAYQEALKIKPNYAAVYFNLGLLYDARGEIEKAVNYYQQAIKIQPNHLKAYSNLASILAKQKKYSAAIEILHQGLEINPTWSTLHNNLGQIYVLDEQLDKAKNSFEMAICLDSTMSLAYSNLSKLWQQKGNFVRAVENLERLISLEPTNVIAFGNLAEVLLRQGKSQQAIKYLRQAIAIEPTFVTTYCIENHTPNSTDLIAIAKASCTKFLTSLQEETADSEVLQYLWQTYSHWGNALLEYGNIEQAETYYRQAIDIQPDEVSLYLSLGNSLSEQKRWNAAINVYQMGLLLDPNYQPIKLQLEKVINKCSQEKQLNQESTISDNFLSGLPQKIYHHTRDWVRDCQLEDYSYSEIFWEGTAPFQHKKQTAVTLNSKSNLDTAECEGLICDRCTAKLIELFQPIYLGNRGYQCSLTDYPDIFAPFPFVVSLPQGKVWNVAQKNLEMSYGVGVITPDNYLLGDLSRHPPWFLAPCPYPEKNTHPIFDLDSLPPLTKLKGKVAVLSGLAKNSYYHWMFDILPRIELIRLSEFDLESIDWFAIDEIKQPFQKESLSMLGIPQTKLITSNQTPFIEAEELIVPSFPGYFNWIPFGTIKFLRQTFLPQIGQQRTKYKSNKYKSKLYISREGAKERNILNEAVLADFLAEWGFQTVYLAQMPLIEQIAVFANAKVIVAPHGSGLTNLVFCSPKTTVIELFSPNYVRPDYWAISQQLDLKHYYCLGESFSCSPLQNIMYRSSWTEDISIDINSLELIFKAARINP